MTYKYWIEDWLENYVKPSVKKRTYERYRNFNKNKKARIFLAFLSLNL